MAGLLWGSILAPLLVGCIVLARSPDRGYDPLSWAWIDVVSEISIRAGHARSDRVTVLPRYMRYRS